DPAKAMGRLYYLTRHALFTSAFAFYVYDWIVLQILYARQPYSLHSFYSFARFACDLFMAFFLFGIVWYAAIPGTLENPALVVRRLSMWHVMAAVWHVL